MCSASKSDGCRASQYRKAAGEMSSSLSEPSMATDCSSMKTRVRKDREGTGGERTRDVRRRHTDGVDGNAGGCRLGEDGAAAAAAAREGVVGLYTRVRVDFVHSKKVLGSGHRSRDAMTMLLRAR